MSTNPKITPTHAQPRSENGSHLGISDPKVIFARPDGHADKINPARSGAGVRPC